MSYSHRVAHYFHSYQKATTRDYNGMMSVDIITRFNTWRFITNSTGWVGIQDLFLLEYVEIEDDGPTLSGTPLINTWSFEEGKASNYHYRIIKNELLNALNEDEYRQLIGTLIALDSYYRNPERAIAHVTWSIRKDAEEYELDMPDTHAVAVPYLGQDVVTGIELLLNRKNTVNNEA